MEAHSSETKLPGGSAGDTPSSDTNEPPAAPRSPTLTLSLPEAMVLYKSLMRHRRTLPAYLQSAQAEVKNCDRVLEELREIIRALGGSPG